MNRGQVKEKERDAWTCGCNDEPPKRAKVFARYVDDVIRTVKMEYIDLLMTIANKLHKNLQFTIEKEVEQSIPFLDMRVTRHGKSLSTSWYSKPTDTGLMLSFHSCAPTKYKRNIVEGNIHRIHQATSTWSAFTTGIERAEKLWEANQYPPDFYIPIVRNTVSKIVAGDNHGESARPQQEKQKEAKKPVFMLQYRGRVSENLARKLRGFGVSTIFTTRKLRSCLPSLKSKFPERFKSNVVYRIQCPGCTSCYVGQTTRHLTTRLTEHIRRSAPLGGNFAECGVDVKTVTAKVIDTCLDSNKLLTLEALYIAEEKPALNSREEYRQRQLTLRF